MAGLNYAKGQPQGNNNIPFFNSPPAIKAVKQYFSENAAASSVITLTENTTALEVTSTGVPVVLRWVPVTETAGVSPFASVIAGPGATANFDHALTSSARVRFVVPIEVINNAQGYSSMVGGNIENGLFRRVAIKTQVVASVYVTEYGSSNSY